MSPLAAIPAPSKKSGLPTGAAQEGYCADANIVIKDGSTRITLSCDSFRPQLAISNNQINIHDKMQVSDAEDASVSIQSPHYLPARPRRNAFARLEQKVSESEGKPKEKLLTGMASKDMSQSSYYDARMAAEEQFIKNHFGRGPTQEPPDEPSKEQTEEPSKVLSKDFKEFWELLQEKHPSASDPSTSEHKTDQTLGEPIQARVNLLDPPLRETPIETADMTSPVVNFRVSPLDEYIVFAPDFSSEAEKEEYYALYAEKFLPPHLQELNTHPTPPVKSSASTGTEPDQFMDMPYPSVFGSLLADEDIDYAAKDAVLRDLEIEWEARWTPVSYSKLLYALEIAREDGIDVLNSLLLKRRQREVVWIAKRIVDKHPDITDPDLKVWRMVNAVGDQDNQKHPSMSNTLQDGMIGYSKQEREDIARRRRGVGVLLSSLTSMLISGWKAEKMTAVKSVFNILTDIDAPPMLDMSDSFEPPSPLIGDAVSHVLGSPGYESENEMDMTSKEIFSTVLQLLAYLHVENHVPPIVYSEKHPKLQAMQSEIARIMTEEVEADYFDKLLGMEMRKLDTKIDWSLWLELVNSIAAERGLGVSATWLLLRGEKDLSWEKDAIEPHEIQTEEPAQPLESYTSSESQTSQRKLILPSYLIRQSASVCLHNAAFDAWPPDTPGRMLRVLKRVGDIAGPYDQTFARELIDHPEVNVFASYGDKIPEIPIKGRWGLDIYYAILEGACQRNDVTGIMNAWASIEYQLTSQSGIVNAQYKFQPELPPVQFAPETAFKHPIHVVIASLTVLRQGSRWDLFRYIIRTVITEQSLRSNSGLLNIMLTHAGDLVDFDLAKYLLTLLAPPLTIYTITSVLNMHLALGQQPEAQAILDFMKRAGIQPDHVTLGIVTRHTFKNNSTEGFGLMRRAAARADAHNKMVMEGKTLTKPFREGVNVPIHHAVSDPIGPNAWFETLITAIRENNVVKASEALQRLGLDLGDPKAASKMGSRVFTILLNGVVKREGSVQGMRMFKMYCLPPKRLLKLMDESVKSHRSGDRRIDPMAHRNKLGMLTGNGPRYPTPPGEMGELKREYDGVVIPTLPTIATVVHQALKEKRDYFVTKQILGKLPMKPQAEKWMKYNAYFETSWQDVLDWGKQQWTLMGLGDEDWNTLVNTRLMGKRYPRSFNAGRQDGEQQQEQEQQGQDQGLGEEFQAANQAAEDELKEWKDEVGPDEEGGREELEYYTDGDEFESNEEQSELVPPEVSDDIDWDEHNRENKGRNDDDDE
ncbi:hypothetical protein AA313_de0207391 [Arthrobotrys entomopaga]|nr:hypothetical protein AA313_de0207391 [Arthrobotrys entomopaga]